MKNILSNSIHLSKIIHRGETRIKVHFKKSDFLISIIKAIPNRKWSQTKKCWHLPYSKESFIQLRQAYGDKALKYERKNISSTPEVILPVETEVQKVKLSKISFTKFQYKDSIQKKVVGEKIIVRQKNINWLNAYVPADKKGWVEAIKNINGRKWNKEIVCWEIPNVKQSFRSFKKYIGMENIQFDFRIQKNIPEEYHCIRKIKYPKPASNSFFNEMQKYAITALEEKLILEGKRQKTISSYLNQLKAFLRFYKNKKPSAITFKEITAYIIIRKKHDNISDSYLNQLINALNAFYGRVLNQEEKIAKLDRPKKRRALPNVFSEEEVQQLLKSCKNLKHKCMLILTYSGGLRKSEVLNLRISDLNYERKTIFIKNGKGGKDRYTFFSPIAIKYLKKYTDQYQPTIWIFEGQSGGQYSESSIQSVFEKAKQESQVNRFVTLHGLRHSFATHLVEKNVPLHNVKELLGHSSIKTTEIYLHISNKFRRELKSPIDDMDI